MEGKTQQQAAEEASVKATERPGEFVQIGESEEEAMALFEQAKAHIAAEFGQPVENVNGWVTAVHLADGAIIIGGNSADPFDFMLHAIAQGSPETLTALLTDGLSHLLGDLAPLLGALARLDDGEQDENPEG